MITTAGAAAHRARLAFLSMVCAYPALAAEPQWLADARAREGTVGALHAVTTPDKQVSFSLPVRLLDEVKDDGDFYLVNFQLAPGVDGACDIFKDDIDVAATLRGAAGTTFANVIEPAQGKVQRKAVERIDAELLGTTPVLTANWLYVVKAGDGNRIGGFRQVAASQAGHGVYCALVDLGYAKTFEQVIGAILASLSPAAEFKAPYYREVTIASVKDMRIGFSQLELRRDGDGDTQVRDSTTMLMTTTGDELKSNDSVHLEWAHPDGSYINGNHIVADNGEIEESVALKTGDHGHWLVDGKFKGQDVKEEIESGEPTSWLGYTRLLRTVLAGDKPVGTEVSCDQWISADPGRLSQMKLKVLAALDAKSYSVRESIGGILADLVVDASTGQTLSGTMDIGPTQIKMMRVLVQGSP